MYHLSIIIPLYNEEKRLQKSLKGLKKFLSKKKKNKVETIFVSDGSTDDTNKLINLFISKNKKFYKFKFIFYQKNVGKGYAIKQGIMKASYDWQLICDADMSVNPNQFNIWYNKNRIIDKNKAFFLNRFNPWGWATWRDRWKQFNPNIKYAVEKLKFLNEVKIIGHSNEKGAILSFTIDNIHSNDIGMILDQFNVAIRAGHHCAQPLLKKLNLNATARASFGI